MFFWRWWHFTCIKNSLNIEENLQNEVMCVEARIMLWSAINSTFGLHNRQKDGKFSFSCLQNIVFLTQGRMRQLRKQGQWISFRLLGGVWGLKDETGRMREVNASLLLCNRHEGLLTRLPCYWPFGRRYPLPQAHRWRRTLVIWGREKGQGQEERQSSFLTVLGVR